MQTFKKILKWTAAILLILMVSVFLFLEFASYSDGYRVGTPIKLSHKGNIIKTYEGEMNVGGLTSSAEGVLPTTWAFSVRDRDEDVRQKLDDAIQKGQRVKLMYKEKYVRFFWRGDTKYFVYDVIPVSN